MNALTQLNNLLQAGRTKEAREVLSRMRLSKDQRLAALAVVQLKEGDQSGAVNLFERALTLNPNEQTAIAGYARYLLQQKKRKQAIDLTERGYKFNPTNPQIIEVHAAALSEMDRISEAIQVMTPLVQGKDPTPQQLISYSSLLRANLEPERALEVLEAHTERLQALPAFQKSIADCVAELDPETASIHFERLGDSASKATKWNRSFTELRLGRFDFGWELYENGLSDEVGRIGRPLPAQVKGIPLVTDIDALDRNKWTLFSTEQGIGDQVLFLSALHQAVKRVPKSVLICEQRLIPIYTRSFPQIQCHPYALVHNFEGQVERLNGIFPIGSLMRHYRRSKADFSKVDFPYIIDKTLLTAQLLSKIRARYSEPCIVGVSWVGGYWDRQQRTKSLEFEVFCNLLAKVPNVRFLSLQYGDVGAAKKYATENAIPITFIDGVDFKKNMESWLSLIALCDYHISVSTAHVHFAAAMGKRVELVLGDRQAPFIWGLSEGKSIPYPSVNIHRKSLRESHGEYFERIRESLQP
jgi:tetratricopeptide (TPR) repeat protein